MNTAPRSNHGVTAVITSDLHGERVFSAIKGKKFLWKTDSNYKFVFRQGKNVNLFRICQNGKKVDAHSISRIYSRRPVFINPATKYAPHVVKFATDESLEVVNAVIGICKFTTNGHVYSQGRAPNIRRNKILQLITAKSVGLVVPETCATNDEGEARKFYDEHDGVIYKTLCQPIIEYEDGRKSMIHTSPVTSNDFHQVSACPCLFQEKLKKDFELRVAIVGEEVRCVRIDSQTREQAMIDWRKAMDDESMYSTYDLPEEVKEQLINFNTRMSLNWSMTDMVVHNGKYIFLEANPDGAWLWLENIIDDFSITKLIASEIKRGVAAYERK